MNDVVLLTGGYGDIGRSLIEKILLETKYNLVVTSRKKTQPYFSEEKRVQHLMFDGSDLNSVKDAALNLPEKNISFFIQLHGHTNRMDSLLGQTHETLLHHHNVNIFSTVLLLQPVLECMIKRCFGRIVLMNTASSEHGGGEKSFGYGMAKHSISYLTKHIAKHYGEHDIIANCLSPGLIETKFQTQVLRLTQKDLQARAKSIRLPRIGNPKHVADLAYLLAFQNSFITGQNIKVDGGDFF